ncbi:OmpA family protein [Sandaracinus amylolyticus]|uniref:OmpA family protein n=1 Tax=Sandaracinus amylolyticus TaxID=927083 RepID=UPI001F3CCC86|nr:OmpA family protein [Sandaracinus amylolyticus]UJR86816.1 Hypothetical protein I5071_89170 [Sandaracinus amylolyticus]
MLDAPPANVRAACAALILAASLFGPAATAQPAATLDRYRPGETPEDDFHLRRPTDLGHLRFGVLLTLDYALDPLVWERMRGDASSESLSVVEHELVGTVGLSLGLWDRLVVYAGLPVVLVMEGDDEAEIAALGSGPRGGPGLGDAYAGARVRLFGEADDVGALALQATVTFPTSDPGDASSYRGEPTVTFVPQLLGELRAGVLRIVLNVGVRIREESESDVSNLAFGHELLYGLGLALPVWTAEGEPRTHFDLHAQIYGDTSLSDPSERTSTALEATGGIRFFHASGVVIGAAAGPGLWRGLGSPDLRAVLNVGWATPPETAPRDRDGDGIFDQDDRCPDEPEDIDAFEDTDGCPDRDDDRDGILDTSDVCRLEPETQNGFDDEDGCPDEIPDTDGDGLRDDVDRCVSDPEDADGWQDEDGCPDPDDDQDGVLDASDACRREPGPAANRGCPDPDRDADTVVDRLDNCPDEPGPPENRGCREQQRVVIEGDRLEILEAVFFRTNGHQILARSFPLLENVARVINSHPEIARVIVEGHTDSRGRRDRNMQLSQRRAESVVRFLVEHGVDPSRLEARGYGPDRPRIPNATTRDEHAQNRRVEFHIPGEHAGIEQGESEATSESIDR